MRRVGTKGEANWGTYTPDPDGICHDCGRDFGGHAGTSCFAPGVSGLPAPRASRDTCPACGGTRRQCIVAPGGFYCSACEKVGPGPVTDVVGAQLELGLGA